LNNLGLVFQEQARYDDAISAYLQVIELYGSIKDTAGRSRALSNLASVYDTRGEWDKAIHHYKLSLQGMDEMADWSTFASLWNNLGVAYQTSWTLAILKHRFGTKQGIFWRFRSTSRIRSMSYPDHDNTHFS